LPSVVLEETALTYPYHVTLLIVCPLVFLASFVDSIAGGGGLISLPSYLIAGIPIKTAYGTNKFSMTFGATTAAINYARNGCVVPRSAIAGAAGALLGAWLGSQLAVHLSERALQIALMVMLPLAAVFVVCNRRFGAPSDTHDGPGAARIAVFSLLIGFAVGAYDGFFGPGAGTFYTLALAGIVRLDLVKATGTAKILNLASGLASAFTFFFSGDILFPVAFPAMASAIAGSFIGSKLTIKIGARFIRAVLVFVVALLFVKIAYDVLSSRYG
jgi:uncharacterized membrane protein YfcA